MMFEPGEDSRKVDFELGSLVVTVAFNVSRRSEKDLTAAGSSSSLLKILEMSG